MNARSQISLTARTIRGAGWVVCWRVATRLLGTISTLLLVRLLAPADFGLVALGTAFAQALDGLSEIGIEGALVREEQLDQSMYDTGFTLAFLRGVTSAVLIASCAWPVAHFFGEPRLIGVLLCLAVAMLTSALENVGIIDFQRDLAFDKELGLRLAPRILGIIACLVVAYVWRSYWALVAGIFTTRSTRMICSYLMHPYRPHFSLRAARRIFRFSFWSWMLTWISLIRDRIDSFVIGRILGASQVGLYSIAWDVGFITSTELVLPICRALFPGLAQVRNRGSDVADAYFRAISATLLLTLPAGVGIALVADPLMRLVVGPRWITAIPLIQIFALVGIFRVITAISTTLLSVFGMLEVQFANTAVILAIRFGLLVALISRFGLIGAGYAVAAVAVLEEAAYLVLTFRRFNLRPANLFMSNWRSLIATVAMTEVVWLIIDGFRSIRSGPSYAELAASVAGGAFGYGLVLLGLWFAAGRPAGAEAQVVAILRETARLVRRR